MGVPVEHVICSKPEMAHIPRLRYYSDYSLEVTEEITNHIPFDEQKSMVEVEKIIQSRKMKKLWHFEILWVGFEETAWGIH